MVPQAIGQQKLNILLTYDGATTWARASGLPSVTSIAASAANHVAGSVGVTLTTPPYPPRTVGDLTAVFMASKSLGWAVGGNDVNLAQVSGGPSSLCCMLPPPQARTSSPYYRCCASSLQALRSC